MVLDIVQAGDPVLREPAAPLDVSHIGTAAFNDLVKEMVETMRDAPGVGLAAPQVGLPIQLVVLEDRPETMEMMDDDYREELQRRVIPLTVLVNPRLELVGREKVTLYEGCLSVSGWIAETERHLSVRVKALNEKGEKVELNWKGYPARILQHEIDHLNGTLYVDRMNTRTFTSVDDDDDDDDDYEDEDEFYDEDD